MAALSAFASDLMRINYDELEDAFLFVSSDPYEESQAFISVESGRIYWVSENLDEETPSDLEEEGKYIEIPSKHELHLGRSLALKFTSESLPDDFDLVYSYFQKSGAYTRFKNLLESRNSLQQWYDYEENAIKLALLEWCKENAVDVGT